MEKYKIGKTKIEMPSGWHEVPFKTGMDILRSPEMSKTELLSLLSGQPISVIRKASDPSTIHYFATAFQFVERMPQNLDTPQMPRAIKFRGDWVIIPAMIHDDPLDLGEAETGMIEDMEMTITNMVKEFLGDEERDITEIEQLEIIPYLVAIYIQKIIDKEYDYGKAIKLVDDVRMCSFKDIIHMGYFFFRKLTALRSGYGSELRRPNSITRKLKLAYWNLINRLGFR